MLDGDQQDCSNLTPGESSQRVGPTKAANPNSFNCFVPRDAKCLLKEAIHNQLSFP